MVALAVYTAVINNEVHLFIGENNNSPAKQFKDFNLNNNSFRKIFTADNIIINKDLLSVKWDINSSANSMTMPVSYVVSVALSAGTH